MPAGTLDGEMSVLTKFLRMGEGKKLRALQSLVPDINALEPELEALSDEELAHKTVEFRERLANGEDLNDLLTEAFAVVREGGKRTIGQRHFDVQLMGGAALHFGWIAEMKTGEGKTLVSTLPVYLNALEGNGVHVVTVNDYLTGRDAAWMGQLHRFLGLTVGRVSPEMPEWQDKKDAYNCDVTYGTNTELGFDYLRDNMARNLDHMVQRGHNFAIVDEVDSILIDEARTPLIISAPPANRPACTTSSPAWRAAWSGNRTTRSTRKSGRSPPQRRASKRSKPCSASTTSTTSRPQTSSISSPRRCRPRSCTDGTRTTWLQTGK